jgi:intracellular proteinase inhibitor BsuPI
VGGSVRLELAIQNRSDQDAVLHLGGRPITFDLVVTRPDGQEVWRRLKGQVLLAILQITRLGPHEALRFVHDWDQRDNTGETVPPGSYLVFGQVHGDPPLTTDIASLSVVP